MVHQLFRNPWKDEDGILEEAKQQSTRAGSANSSTELLTCAAWRSDTPAFLQEIGCPSVPSHRGETHVCPRQAQHPKHNTISNKNGPLLPVEKLHMAGKDIYEGSRFLDARCTALNQA